MANTTFPKINNWNEVKKQFGFNKKDGHKNAIDISTELRNRVNSQKGAGVEKMIFIPVSNCIDAIFVRVLPDEASSILNIPCFEYTGTCG